MDTLTAFAFGQASKGRGVMVFDWEKAARLIKKRKAKQASAGLSGDWDWTGGLIFENGKPVPKDKTYTYLASTWATPEIEIDGVTEDCYKMQSQTPKWDAKTYWPKEARQILKK